MTKSKRAAQVVALKVKVKSLAAEARIIKLEEAKAWKRKNHDLYVSLGSHRRCEVRREQRAALLAYAFIRGHDYTTVERPKAGNDPDLKRVRQLVEKFGSPPNGYPACTCPPETLAQWVAASLAVHPFAAEAKAA